MSSSNAGSASGGGIGFCGLLTIVFITLKLCKVIDWGWLWVLGPLWIPLTLLLSIGAAVLIVLGLIWLGAVVWEKATTSKASK